MAHWEDDPNSRQTTVQSNLLLVPPAGKRGIQLESPQRVVSTQTFIIQERPAVMEEPGGFQAVWIQLQGKVKAAQATPPSFL